MSQRERRDICVIDNHRDVIACGKAVIYVAPVFAVS